MDNNNIKIRGMLLAIVRKNENSKILKWSSFQTSAENLSVSYPDNIDDPLHTFVANVNHLMDKFITLENENDTLKAEIERLKTAK